MNRRNIFFVIGSLFLAIGTISGGLVKIYNGQAAAGVFIIVIGAAIIVLCSLPVIHANRNNKR